MSNSMVHHRSMSNSDRGRSIVASNSLIGDLLDSITIVCVLDSLDPAVRESHSVAARGGIAILLLILGELGSTVVIINTIAVGIYWGLSQVTSSLHNHGGSSILGGSRSSSHQGGNHEDLHVCDVWCSLELIPM